MSSSSSWFSSPDVNHKRISMPARKETIFSSITDSSLVASSSSTPGTATLTDKSHGNQQLMLKLFGDAIVGVSVTLCVAPFLAIVDKAIVQHSAGSHTFLKSSYESIRGILKNPVNFIKSPTFLLMWGVYAATYTTANSLKTIVEHQQTSIETKKKDSSASNNSNTNNIGKLGVFFGTSFVNSAASLWKDRAYAHIFGKISVNNSIPKVPLASYGLWMGRDFLVIGSSFLLPDILANAKNGEENSSILRSCGLANNEQQAKQISQLVCPIVAQFFAAPLHLMGLDLYNRPLHMSFQERTISRLNFLYNNYTTIVLARIARIAPGYGIGGVLNTEFRDSWREFIVASSTHTKENILRLEGKSNRQPMRF